MLLVREVSKRHPNHQILKLQQAYRDSLDYINVFTLSAGGLDF